MASLVKDVLYLACSEITLLTETLHTLSVNLRLHIPSVVDFLFNKFFYPVIAVRWSHNPWALTAPHLPSLDYLINIMVACFLVKVMWFIFQCDMFLGLSLQVKHSCVHLRWTSILPHGGVWWDEQSHPSTIPSVLRWLSSDQRWAPKQDSSAIQTRRLYPGTHSYTPCVHIRGHHWSCPECVSCWRVRTTNVAAQLRVLSKY